MIEPEYIKVGRFCEFSERYRGFAGGSVVDFVEVFYSSSFMYFEIPSSYDYKHINNIIQDFVLGKRTLTFITLPATAYLIDIEGNK